MENALSTLSILPANKSELASFKNSLKNAILNGTHDGLEVKRIFKILEEIVKVSKDDDVKEMINSEADKYHDKTFEYIGCEFSKADIPAYDYSACNDSELTMIEQELKRLSEACKARKSFLASLNEPYINQETGEVVLPPIKTTNTQIRIKLK